MRFRKREAELKQSVKMSLGKYVGMFHHGCSKIIFISINAQPHIFRISMN